MIKKMLIFLPKRVGFSTTSPTSCFVSFFFQINLSVDPKQKQPTNIFPIMITIVNFQLNSELFELTLSSTSVKLRT